VFVQKDFRKDSQPLTSAAIDYLLFRVEKRSTREDWRSLGAIDELFQQAGNAALRDDIKLAEYAFRSKQYLLGITRPRAGVLPLNLTDARSYPADFNPREWYVLSPFPLCTALLYRRTLQLVRTVGRSYHQNFDVIIASGANDYPVVGEG
jgi:hypothetical protein